MSSKHYRATFQRANVKAACRLDLMEMVHQWAEFVRFSGFATDSGSEAGAEPQRQLDALDWTQGHTHAALIQTRRRQNAPATKNAAMRAGRAA